MTFPTTTRRAGLRSAFRSRTALAAAVLASLAWPAAFAQGGGAVVTPAYPQAAAASAPSAAPSGAAPVQAPQGAQHAEPAAPNAVVITGTVPDESTRQAILQRALEVYGIDHVVDQLAIGPVAAPPNWSGYVQKLITPSLKQVTKGQLAVNGNNVDLKGEVGSDAVRQQVVGEVSQSLNPTYQVRNALRVASNEQAVVDAALANRIVEFESGSATLTPKGRAILDEMVPPLKSLPAGQRIQIIGHTDNQGSRDANIALSAARADAVRAYLVSKAVNGDILETSGAGPDRPVVANDTAEGRARNRRIEFRVSQ